MKYQLFLTIAFCASLTASAQKYPYQNQPIGQRARY